MESLQRSLRFLVIFRLVVVGTIVLSSILIQATAGVVLPLFYLYGVGAVTALLSVFYLGTRERLPLVAQAYIQISGDLILVTALVYYSGGSDSVFTFLYLVVVGVAAFLLLRSGALLVASFASFVYGLMIELTSYEILPPPPFSTRSDWSRPAVIFNMCFNIAAFYAVAILTSLVAEKLAFARTEIVARRREFEKIRALHADVIESMSSGLATLDADGRVTLLNRAGAEILKLDRPVRPDLYVWDLGFLDRAEWFDLRISMSASASPRGEREIVDGPRRRVIGFSTRVLEGTEGYLLLFQDLTDFKKLEEEARSRERLAAVGQLAAGIAHEIRNPLASISGSAQMLGNEMTSGSSERRLVEIMVSESRRLSRILEDFLRYARPQPPSTRRFDVATSLSEAIDLFSNSDEVTPRHRLNLRIEPGDSLVSGDPDQVRQIFWNVARNAVSAMPEGGTLDVVGRDAGAWYSIVFRDTGQGMTPERKALLFQPFAAAFGGGTGLGMAIVRRLVDDHGGQIFVESGEGRGTEIEIRLPRGSAEGRDTSAA
jgi:two-component system sensor histidine kinase PilS (NtrC family)